jgi:hypothetical protein
MAKRAGVEQSALRSHYTRRTTAWSVSVSSCLVRQRQVSSFSTSGVMQSRDNEVGSTGEQPTAQD